MRTIKKQSVFLRWFFSYLIMMGLVILLSIGIYFFSYGIINEQAVQVNRTLLEKMQVEIDSYFMEARSTVTSLMLDNSVQKAVKVKGPFSMGDREMLHDIHTNIMNKSVSSRRISHMFIYFVGGNTVISENGHMDSKLFYNLYYQQEGWSSDDFSAMMRQEWTGVVESVRNSKGEMEILFLQNAFPRGIKDPEATFAISITDMELNRWMEEIKWDDTMELLMVHKNGIVIGREEIRQAVSEQEQGTEALLEAQQVEMDGVWYHLTIIPSVETDFCYVALSPVGSIQQGARRIQMFMIIGLVLCITLGILMAYILTGINYHPLRHIMDMFGNYGKDGVRESKNEYQWLTDQTIRFLEEHHKIKKRFYDNEQILKNQYLYRLVTLPYEGESESMDRLKEGGAFRQPYSLVILLHLLYSDDSQWQAEMERGLLRFILTNVMKELFDQRYGLEMVELNDSIACVVNAAQDGPQVREELDYILDQFQKFIQEKMKMKLSSYCGSFRKGTEGIYQSYLMAREASEYGEQFEEQHVIWYEDIQNRHTFYDYSMETEQKIVNAIKAGNEKNACSWVEEVIEENYKSKEIIPTMRKCLLFELFGTVLKGAEQGGGVEFAGRMAFEREFPERMEAEEAKLYFQNAIQGLCAEIRQKEQDKRDDKQFGRRVMEYVGEHFQDPDLNISITALHFCITPSYLSSLFKEQTGFSLLEYINKIRVEKVKELLEQGMSVVDICPLTGFRSSGALIRVFKKNTGITPGQMRKLKE